MNTQFTPFHASLWHCDFILLVVAQLLLGVSVYMQIPPLCGTLAVVASPQCVGSWVAMGLFGVGLGVFGPFSNWLSQYHRRNRVFLVSAIGVLAMLAIVSLPVCMSLLPTAFQFPVKAISWFLMGAFYGMSKRLLLGVLMIDKCESFNRNDANIVSLWCHLASLVLAFMLALWLPRLLSPTMVGVAGCSLALLSIVLVALVRFPFKAPIDDVSRFSCDRFFASHDVCAIIALLLVYVAFALVMVMPHRMLFYAMLLAGFVVSMLTDGLFRSTAECNGEATVGCVVACAALIVMRLGWAYEVFYILSPLLLGIAMGYVCGGMMKRMLAGSRHCKRGTVMSTFFLSADFGLSAGLCLAFSSLPMTHTSSVAVAVLSCLVALAACQWRAGGTADDI